MKLETERLILRDLGVVDLEPMQAYAGCPENVKYMDWGPNSEEETRRFLAECEQWQNSPTRLHYDFAIVCKQDGRMIGSCGIYLNEELNEGMLGWILHRDYWKRGYMPEAARALLAFGFEDLRLHRIYATCDADNYGSWRVMEKSAMRREGHFLKKRLRRTPKGHEWCDEYHYAMLAEEWKK